jgi:methionyl-tRNA formyltransferase
MLSEKSKINDVSIIGSGIVTKRILSRSKLNISGVFYLGSPDINLVEYCDQNNIRLYPLSRYTPSDSSLTVLVECPKIIPAKTLERGIWLNLHFGILPTWKGFSANSWALLNNEEYLGWTLHVATQEFDSGPILIINKIKNDGISLYDDLKEKLVQNLEDSFDKLISEYLEGRIVPIEQSKVRALYCAKLLKSDGVIKDFNVTSNRLKNLSRLFIHKDYTDLTVQTGSGKFEIFGLEEISNDYVGITGKVLKHDSSKLLIKTLDSAVWLEFKSESAALEVKRDMRNCEIKNN